CTVAMCFITCSCLRSFTYSTHLLYVLSFPTRRSSDLDRVDRHAGEQRLDNRDEKEDAGGDGDAGIGKRCKRLRHAPIWLKPTCGDGNGGGGSDHHGDEHKPKK